ncbi:glycerol-3-phosphate dehydrogenase/oxidase [Lysinibacter cavernae]|uniref:Glycerol-3-phosphate dehydrogenase n=1 Tax=Lysinibacter cavernae TaxID=1640652 RepID=A0A7X5R427_9MICO|nr:glycerol-3-phosphate dehydrogenase/oxidase [Lysinibacter cavernae]NIH55182.1 glycerol-3-phosphate dehydrogenase [Lysinibacter cavernae]
MNAKTTPSSAETSTRESVRALAAKPRASVVVIGGGINGIATFRDLALQGVDVILVERGDWCSGASSASSHMIHGGIRYLENGEFRLVRESVQERNGLLQIAPHYVKPLPTTVPIFSTFSGILSAPMRFLTHRQGKPNERGAFLIKAGLVLYDSFSRGSKHSDAGQVPRHKFAGRRKSLAELPKLNHDLKYTATYFDASMHDPERLALDVLMDGLAAGPHARAANYVEAIGMDGSGVIVRDTQSGETMTLAADVIVNTSGPWTDLTNEALGMETKYMGGTKGSHIVLDNTELLEATGGHEIFFEHSDGRIVLIYPLKGRVMVGTTDIDADPSMPSVCTEEEVDYFFDLIRHVFPTVEVDREQIVYRFSGIRPLPRHDDTQPGFVSRDYRIERRGGTMAGARKTPTVLSLVGGKWTTFRALAEHLSQEVLTALGLDREVSTAGMPIGGGKGFPRTDAARAEWVRKHRGGLSAERTDELLTRYGTRAEPLIDYLDEHGDVPLIHAAHYSRQELDYLIETEFVVSILDVIMRRTSLAFVGSVTAPLIDELADVLAADLGWSAAERRQQVEATRQSLEHDHGVRLEASHDSSTVVS